MHNIHKYIIFLLIITIVLLSQPSNGLTCYSCSNCNDPFNPKNITQITVPYNQGYYCRKTSILTIVDRDVFQWCEQGDINGNGLWCCQTNLCNNANMIVSTGFLTLSLTLAFTMTFFFTFI